MTELIGGRQFGFQKSRLRGLPYRGRRPSVPEPLEPLHAQCAGSFDESVPGMADVTSSRLIMESVYPKRTMNRLNREQDGEKLT